jgi:hypothetical protein
VRVCRRHSTDSGLLTQQFALYFLIHSTSTCLFFLFLLCGPIINLGFACPTVSAPRLFFSPFYMLSFFGRLLCGWTTHYSPLGGGLFPNSLPCVFYSILHVIFLFLPVQSFGLVLFLSILYVVFLVFVVVWVHYRLGLAFPDSLPCVCLSIPNDILLLLLLLFGRFIGTCACPNCF